MITYMLFEFPGASCSLQGRSCKFWQTWTSHLCRCGCWDRQDQNCLWGFRNVQVSGFNLVGSGMTLLTTIRKKHTNSNAALLYQLYRKFSVIRSYSHTLTRSQKDNSYDSVDYVWFHGTVTTCLLRTHAYVWRVYYFMRILYCFGFFTAIKWHETVFTFSSALDFINVMTYDFHGAWEKGAGHNAPLYKAPTDTGVIADYNIVSLWMDD